MNKKKFEAVLGCEAGPLFFRVPFDVKAAFGHARAAVKVTVDGHEYRSTVSVYSGKFYVPLRKDRREEFGLHVGDEVRVTLEPDVAAREVEAPKDLRAAFAKDARAKERWAELSYSRRKEIVDSLTEAKRPETRARRLARFVADLG